MGKRKNDEIVCKLTGVAGPPVEAHIIPKSLFQFERKPGLILDPTGPTYKEKRSPMGEYDTTILTNEGEKLFSKCDNYAADFLLNINGRNAEKQDIAEIESLDDGGSQRHVPSYSLFKSGSLDVVEFKKFCMAVLWRAAVSSRNFFAGVDIGEHERPLRELILNADAGSFDDFTVMIAQWNDTPDHGWPAISPRPITWEGLHFFRFDLPQISFFIKVDHRPIPDNVREIFLGGAPDTHVLRMGNFREDPSARALAANMQQYRSNRAS